MADNLITTNITAHADFTSLRTQLAAVTAQLVKLQETTAGTNAKLANQIAVMNKSFAETMRSTGQFSSHFVSLSSDVDKFGKNLDRGRLKLNDYYNAWNGHTKKTSNLIKDLAKQQVMLEQAIIQPIGKNAQGLMQYNVMVAKGLDEVKNKMNLARQEAAIMNKVMLDGSNQLINWGKNTQWAGRQLTVGLTVPLVAFGAAAQKAFREADAELVRLTKVYGGLSATSAADLAKIRKDVSATAKEIAGAYGVAYKDTISLAADLAATGKQGNDLLQATQQTTRLAVLGEVDRQDAMKATLAIQNAFKQNTDELTQSIDFLNAVENQTSTSLADLTEAIPKAGPVIKALGGDVKDLALYLTAMKEGGVNAAEGANAIKSAMASLINPTKVAKEMFAGFGIDLKGIVTKDAGDLTQTILDLQSALDALNPLDKSRAIEQLFGKFQFARMSALFENLGKQGSQTLQVMDLMKASASDLANISSRELKLMTESASGQFKRAWASVQADLAQTGEQFLKISTKVLKVVDSIIKFFQHLPGPVKTFLNALGGITAIAGPLIMMAGVMGNFIGYVVKGIFHLRQLAKGGQGFKLLTPEIMAAEAAAKGLATSFYSDSEATIVLSNAVNTLSESFANLEMKANAAKTATQPAISTVAGGMIMGGGPGQRVVDKNNPLVGAPYSRDMSHLIPSGTQQAGTIFGTVPGAGPVNVRIGKNPQAYMNQDMPKIPGVTSVNGTSTGIVAQEAAKWHAMTAAIAMQSEAEIKTLKAEVMATGTVTSSLAESYQALLPQFSEITQLAAAETQAIVAELQASKITVDQARAKVIAMNATVEAMLAETAAATAAGMGRVANLTTVPLTSQPVVDPLTGKSNMKEMFHKGTTKDIVDKIARALGGVRTSGAGYNIQTTKPKFADGGIVPGTGNSDTYHTTAEAGSFVINKKSTQENMPIISNLLGGTPTFAEGGQVPVVLTPGEAVIPAKIAENNMPLMHALNGGPGNSGPGHDSGGKALFFNSNTNFTAAAEFNKLERYIEHLSSYDYESRRVPNILLNNATALMDHVPGMTITKAIAEATIADKRARMAHAVAVASGYEKGTDYYTFQREFIARNYPNMIVQDKTGTGISVRDKRDAAGTSATNRTQIARLLKQIYPHYEIEDYAHRAHFVPIAGSAGAKGYYGEAAHDKYNLLGNDLRKSIGIQDVSPVFNEQAVQHADHIAQKLGFEDHVDFMYNKSNIEHLIKTGKWVGDGPVPLGLIKHLKGNLPVVKATRSAPVQRMRALRRNAGGSIPGSFAQRLFGGGKALFLGMPKTIKQVEQQRAFKAAMEKANLAVKDSRFAKHPVTEYGDLLEPTSGRSFPVPGIGGIYTRNGEKVFVKPMLDEKAALAEMRATQIAREAHGLKAPKQSVNVMRDPTDPKGLRKLLVLESPFDKALTVQDGKFTTDQYFRQLLASSLRGDKDLGRGNLSGNVLSDVGTAGVFATASGLRDYSAMMPSVGNQAMINLLGVKGSGAKKFFAESTMDIPAGMTADAYHSRMLSEIETTLPRLKKTIGSFDLNQEEKVIYAKMIKRLEDARKVNWSELHGVHASVVPSKETNLTPAALAKIAAAEELKRRQSGHIVSLSDAGFKSSANGFAIGGLIGNVLKGKAMHRIGAGFGPTGAPKPSTFESAPWGVNSLSIQMAETLFANTGLRKHTQKLFYDKFAAALAKEKPYGYVKDAQGSLKNALEPDVLDSVIRSAASDMIGDRAVLSKLSPIDKDILRKKFLNWESKKDTPLTESLKQVIFGLEKREMGGPVNAGQPYVVGEKGPEIFVPRNSGGIVPNNKYDIGGTVGLLATMIAPQILASKISNPLAATIAQTVSFVLPQMIMQSMAMKKMAGGTPGKIMSRIPASIRTGATTPIGVVSGKTGGLTKYGSALTNMASSGSKVASVLSKIGFAATRLNVGLAVLTTAIIVGKNRWDAYKESMRLNALGYGMTAEAAQKAGLKFTDFNGKLKAVVADAKSVIEHNKMLYESMTTSGTPLKLTIEQYKKLKTEVKSTYKDQIALINKTSGKDQADLAVRLKEQFIAMGISAEDATAKIYTMYKLSNKAASASLYTFGNKRFTNRKDAATAAVGAIGTYDQAASTKRDATEQANALNTALMGTDTAISTKYNEMLKARKKDKTKPSFISTGELDQMKLDAESQTLDAINSKLKTQGTLTKETIDELAKENPEIRKIATTQDTVVSLWQKTRLEARGYTGDLSALNAVQTAAAYKMAEAVAGNVEGQNRIGLLKKQYDALDKLKGLQEKYTKAMKGQSVASQISDRDKLAAINKQIDAINKLADARKKALEDKKNTEDTGRAIEAKKLELQNAEATGNTAGAQQARLDLEGLIKGQQYDQQIKAIDAKAKADIAPLTKQAEAINKKQQAMGDAAALAGEKMGDLTKKIEKLETPMNAFNKALTAYEIAIKLHADDLGKWKTTDEAKGMLAAITAAATAAKVDTAGLPVDKATGKIGADAGQALFDKVAPGIEAALQKSGITLNGDLIVNGKKIDMTPTASAPAKTSLVVGADNNLSLGSVKASGIKQNQGSYIGQEFLDKYGVKYKIINDRYGQIQVAKAGYGTMKLDPRIPTIVGDRGPEMAFGGMVIPNMAKIPYASPRYDVNQAAKMFEPMRDANAGQGIINYTQHIHASPGMNEAQLITKAKVAAVEFLQATLKQNEKMVGVKRT